MGLRVILALALALALIPWGAEAALPVDPVTGDIWISTDITVYNETIAPEKNLTVGKWSTLTLIDCRLVMNPYTRIWVSGSLVMRNVTITCNTSAPLYAFLCFGQVDMDGCNVSNSQSWTLGRYSYDCSITNSTFNMSGAGIEVQNGTPRLRGNRFIAGEYMSYLSPMVSVRNSAPVLERNTFHGSSRRYDGLEVQYPASPLVANNTFVNCSMALLFYYIHQHGDGGGVSPPPENPARLDDNAFQNCLYGIMTSDSPMGHGQGRAIAPRAGPEPDPIFIAGGNRFENCTNGIYANGEAPSVINRCGFSGNQEGVLQSQSYGMQISSCDFSNNSVGVRTSSGDLSLSGCTFDRNDRNLLCDNTASVIEGNTFNGGVNTSVSLYSYSDLSYYFANNTLSRPNAIGLRLEGTGVIFNNTFRDCPFGVYRAVRMYGQGHGRDSSQGPTSVQEMALIMRNRFENNTRGVYTEGWSNITENEFAGNGAGVEVSRFIHPVDTGNLYRDTGGPVDLLRVDQNTFTDNSDGVLLLCTNPYGDDRYLRDIRDNLFVNNTIGIDLLRSEADCAKNNFSQNGGWAFRQMESVSALSKNEFGRCDRLWRQVLHPIEVLEPPDGDPLAPPAEYVLSDNATVDIRDQAGNALYLEGRTSDGLPQPQFSPDGFPFSGVNVTTELELANGSVQRTGAIEIEARKPGRGMDRKSADPFDGSLVTLYLEPTPDIVVSNFTFSKSRAIAGELLSANFTIVNDNTYDPANVSLQEAMVGVLLDGASFQTVRIPWLRPGVPEVRRIDWTATAGNHTWTVLADPQGLFRELRKDNNRATCIIDINGRPESVLEADRSGVFSGQAIWFSGKRSSDDGSVSAYFFDFGDGAVSGWAENITVVHSYSRPGLYAARLKVRDDLSLESDWSASVQLSVGNRPQALTQGNARTDLGTLEPLNLSVNASDPEEGVLTVSWDFGDESRLFGRELFSVSHQYSNDGTYTVLVSVSDPDGGVANVSQIITVRNRPPTASFVASPPEGTVLTRFLFMPAGRDSDGRVQSFSWEMGDGNKSVLERPTHNFGAPGEYNVSLTVRDDDGAGSAPFFATIKVRNNPPVARARLSTHTPKTGQPVTFDASASFDNEGPSLTMEWDFGDGAVASGAIVSHAFRRPGNYTVRVRVTDSSGAVSEAAIPVTVYDGPAGAEDDGWKMASYGGGILALAGVVFLAWVLGHRPKKPRNGPRPIRRARPARTSDAYERQLAQSRKLPRSRKQGDRSMYDAMQPVRKNDK